MRTDRRLHREIGMTNAIPTMTQSASPLPQRSLFSKKVAMRQSNPGERDEPEVNRILHVCAAGQSKSAAVSELAQADPPAAFGPIHSSTKFCPYLGFLERF